MIIDDFSDLNSLCLDQSLEKSNSMKKLFEKDMKISNKLHNSHSRDPSGESVEFEGNDNVI